MGSSLVVDEGAIIERRGLANLAVAWVFVSL